MTINQYDFNGKKAIVRVDFNVPLQDGKITDDTRIRGALPTLKLILEKGGALIIMSHMGKPKGKVKPELSLSQIVDAVSAALGVEVKFAPDCAKAQEAAAALKPGEVLLLENLRYYPEEEGKPVGIDKADPAYDEAKKEMKARQKEFAKTLASYADCYVMDAFGTAHRKHASTAVIADYFDAENKMLGLLMEKEVAAVDAVLGDIKRPFIAIMGGSKVSSKIGIIENLLGKVDKLILCGGMTYTFAKAHNGEVGKSICELDKLDVALGVEELAKKNGVELVMAPDAICAPEFSNDAPQSVCPSNAIPATLRVLMQDLRHRSSSLRLSRAARLSFGMVLPECSSLTTSVMAHALSAMLSLRRQQRAHSLSSVVETLSLVSISSALQTRCLTSQQVVALSLRLSRARCSQVLLLSRANIPKASCRCLQRCAA